MITISLVSHGHGNMVVKLISQLLECPEVSQIILTQNIAETIELPPIDKLEVIVNTVQAGFGANHNAAFKRCASPFFCVLNPDIILQKNPFPLLLEFLDNHNAVLAAPLVVSSDGKPEDSIRAFPTPLSLLIKASGGPDGRYQIDKKRGPLYPDWVAGMFMVFNSDQFRKLGGFDEGYFLYYEDVDICARIWKNGGKIIACPIVSVVHAAQRESHRNIRYLSWHLASMLRFFTKHLGRLSRPESSS